MDILMEAKVLRRAADLVEQGWCRGNFGRAVDGRALGASGLDLALRDEVVAVCADGALQLAAAEMFGSVYNTPDVFMDYRQVVDRVLEALPIHADPDTRTRQHLWNWNDAAQRTSGDVAVLFRQVADTLEQEG